MNAKNSLFSTKSRSVKIYYWWSPYFDRPGNRYWCCSGTSTSGERVQYHATSETPELVVYPEQLHYSVKLGRAWIPMIQNWQLVYVGQLKNTTFGRSAES